MTEKHRLLELDTFRGIASLLVMLFHFSTGVEGINPKFIYGNTAVDFFFIISGFVIYMSLQRCKSVKDFFWGRVKRLFPAYWVSIVVALVTYYLFTQSYSLTPAHLIGNILMVQPIFRTEFMVDAYWTLYVELTFYVFIGIAWFYLRRFNIDNIILISLIVTILLNAGYLIFSSGSPYYERIFVILRGLFPLTSHFNMFAAGIIFYQIYQDGATTRRCFILTMAFLTTLLVHDIGGRVFYLLNIYQHMATTAIYFFLFSLLTMYKLPAFLTRKYITIWGTISYSLYLVHQSIGLSISKFLIIILTPEFSVLIGMACSIIFAFLINILVERPFFKFTQSYKVFNS